MFSWPTPQLRGAWVVSTSAAVRASAADSAPIPRFLWKHTFFSLGHMPRSGIARLYTNARGFPGGASGKEPACQCRKRETRGFDPWVKKIS